MADQQQELQRRDDLFAQVWRDKFTSELNDNVQLRAQLKAHEETLRHQSEQLQAYQQALEDFTKEVERLERERQELLKNAATANVVSGDTQPITYDEKGDGVMVIYGGED